MKLIRNLHTFESLGLKDYRLLWLGQLCTSTGIWMDQVTRAWLIYVLTHSALQLGLVSAVRGTPFIVFGGIAGAVADRYGRKAQLIIAQVVNAVLNIILATLVLTGNVQPWHVYVTAFLNGTVQAFQFPARQVLINDLVGRKLLLNAVSLSSAAVNVSRSVGPALSGVLIQALGVDISYFIQAGLFLLATVWTVQIRIPESHGPPRESKPLANQSLLSSTKEGLAYIVSNRLILALMVLGLAPVVMGMSFVSLMPIFAIDVFHGGAATQGLLLMLLGIGAILGALTIASLGRSQTNGNMLIAGAAGFGLCLILFSRSPVMLVAAFFILLAGFSNASYSSQNQTMLQLLTPAPFRGRVLGIYLLNNGLMPVGSLLAGILATFLGGPWAVTVMGTSCFLIAVGVGFCVPRLWQLRFIPEI
jgi:MFS transporter, DHA1 family, staphyloferrin A biosynthesis exporter